MLKDEFVIDFVLGELYFIQGVYVKVVLYYEEMVKEWNEIGGVNVYQRLVELLSVVGEFEEVFLWYEKVAVEYIELNMIFGYGFIVYQVGMFKIVIKQLFDLKGFDFFYLLFYMLFVKSFEVEGMYEDVLKIVKEGIIYDEYNKEFFFYVGKMVLKFGNEDEGKKFFQEVLVFDLGYVEVFYMFLVVYYKEESFEEIIDLIQEVCGYGEEDLKYNWYLVSVYMGFEQYVEVKKSFEVVYFYYQEDWDFLYEYVYFLLEEGFQKEVLLFLK